VGFLGFFGFCLFFFLGCWLGGGGGGGVGGGLGGFVFGLGGGGLGGGGLGDQKREKWGFFGGDFRLSYTYIIFVRNCQRINKGRRRGLL